MSQARPGTRPTGHRPVNSLTTHQRRRHVTIRPRQRHLLGNQLITDRGLELSQQLAGNVVGVDSSRANNHQHIRVFHARLRIVGPLEILTRPVTDKCADTSQQRIGLAGVTVEIVSRQPDFLRRELDPIRMAFDEDGATTRPVDAVQRQKRIPTLHRSGLRLSITNSPPLLSQLSSQLLGAISQPIQSRNQFPALGRISLTGLLDPSQLGPDLGLSQFGFPDLEASLLQRANVVTVTRVQFVDHPVPVDGRGRYIVDVRQRIGFLFDNRWGRLESLGRCRKRVSHGVLSRVANGFGSHLSSNLSRDDQQQENQRPHRADQNSQKGKQRHGVSDASCGHRLLSPAADASQAALVVPARADSKLAAAVRLINDCSNTSAVRTASRLEARRSSSPASCSSRSITFSSNSPWC